MAEEQPQPAEPLPPEERSTQRTTTGERVGDDQFIVRLFTVADYAVVPPDGKLYISGGGISAFNVREAGGALTPFHVVARVKVPWNLSSESHRMELRVLDGDRRPIAPLPDPAHSGDLETGRPPGARPEDELCIQLVVGLAGLPVPNQSSMYFHLLVNGQTLAVLPVKLRRIG